MPQAKQKERIVLLPFSHRDKDVCVVTAGLISIFHCTKAPMSIESYVFFLNKTQNPFRAT